MKISNNEFHEERALFRAQGISLSGCRFDTGESPLKESRDITIKDTVFDWKYPLWYSKNIEMTDSLVDKGGRAGIWYTDNIKMMDSDVNAPKNFRRCSNVEFLRGSFPDAQETLWECSKVRLYEVEAAGDYFAMNCEDIEAEVLTLNGNYGFDGCRKVTVRNSVLNTKDAFWNCENVTVYDSKITGEYFGWNSKNLTLINCEISSLQGFCYIDGLVMKDCRCEDTSLAFEYSNALDIRLSSVIKSVLNPGSGRIECEYIGNLIKSEQEKGQGADIVCKEIRKTSDEVDWDEV